MIRKDNIVKIIVAIILIVGAIVLLANNTIKWSGNNNESLNSALNVENIEDTNYLQDVGNTVNPYLEKQEDGQIENNSPELKREKQFKEIEINNIKFVYNPGNKMTTITADLKNVGTEEQKQEIVEKYRKQLELYKRALEEATGKKVFKSYLCLANRDWNCYEVK